jgi:CheY-like chemotaxis protein
MGTWGRDAAILRLRKVLLNTAGFSVITAASGPEALEMLARGTDVDLVLLDYLMPGMNGDVLAENLRQRYPNLRLIAVSAVGQLPATLLNAVDSHVQKGQDPEILLSVISAVLAQSTGQHNAQLNSAKTVLCVEDEKLQLQLRRSCLKRQAFMCYRHSLPAQRWRYSDRTTSMLL